MLILLVSWPRNSQHKSIVIPGNPGEGRGRPGIQEFQNHLDTGFLRYDGYGVINLFVVLLSQDTSQALNFVRATALSNLSVGHLPSGF